MKDDWTPGCNVKADVPDDQKGRHYDVFEEVVLLSGYLRKHGVLSKISERVRFVRPTGCATRWNSSGSELESILHDCIGYIGHLFRKQAS
jgi:hypothetical protein